MNERELHLADLKSDLEIAQAKAKYIKDQIEELESKMDRSGETQKQYEKIIDFLTKPRNGISNSQVLLNAQGRRILLDDPILKDISLYVDTLTWGEDLEFCVYFNTNEHRKFDGLLRVDSEDWALEDVSNVAKVFNIPAYLKVNSILTKLHDMLVELTLEDEQCETIQKLVVKKRK